MAETQEHSKKKKLNKGKLSTAKDVNLNGLIQKNKLVKLIK